MSRYETDPELIADFFDEFDDIYEVVSQTLERINQLTTVGNHDLDPIFRAAHSIKSNLRMMGLIEVSELVHKLENVLQMLRAGNIEYTLAYGNIINLVIEEAKVAAEKALKHGHNNEELTYIANLIDAIANEEESKRDEAIEIAINILDPFDTMEKGENKVLPYPETGEEPNYKFIENDLILFEEISNAIINRINHLGIYYPQLANICMTMNKLAEYKIENAQLQAAVYLSHLGLGTVPLDIINKKSPSTSEYEMLMEAPLFSANFLKNLPYWHEAMEMIQQINENVDGSGTPLGLKEQDICEGAKLLHVAISYIRILNHKKGSGVSTRTMMAAILEINKHSGIQFSEYWVDIFNKAIKICHQNNKQAG